jgi:hypothetical protein
MRTTLAQAKQPSSGIQRSINIAACDGRFVEYVNNAQQRLSEMGQWWGTYRRIWVCLSSACVTWPREVANPQGFRICNQGIDLVNEWYEFGESVKGFDDDLCGPPSLVERPNACQFLDTTALSKIRIYPTVAADAGVKILLQGIEGNGNPIRTEVGTSYVDGEQVTLASPFVTTTFEFAAPGLLGVQKPITKGRLNVFSVDPDSGLETKIAIWEASEVNPSYRRHWIPNMPGASSCCATTGNGCSAAPECSDITGEAIVRLEFIPATVDTDWLFISNLQAVACGVRAISYEEKNNQSGAEIEWARAIRILRNELEKYSPATLTRVNVQPHGSAHPRRIFGGFN